MSPERKKGAFGRSLEIWEDCFVILATAYFGVLLSRMT
jgi:hypothetical protein